MVDITCPEINDDSGSRKANVADIAGNATVPSVLDSNDDKFLFPEEGKEQRLVGHLLLLLAAEEVAKYWRWRAMLPPSGEPDVDLLCCYC